MKKNLSKFVYCFFIAVMLFSTTEIGAVPAKRTPFVVTQPDGSTLTILLKGDENFHYRTTTDGYLVQEDDKGYFRYASLDSDNKVVLSSVKASDIQRRNSSEESFLRTVSTEKMLSVLKDRPSARKKVTKSPQLMDDSFPREGDVKALVILVEFKDKSFSASNGYDRFNNMMNQTGYSTGGATGSCRDYYVENSNGKFRPQFDVYGPVKLSQNMSYYGGNDANGDDMRPDQMVIEACQALDATIDFSEYDTNNDGWVDNVYVFYAGLGENDGGTANTIWPHSWGIYSGAGKSITLDGVKLDTYGCSNEIQSSGDFCNIGTFTHEFGHVLGLPDIYSTNYNSSSFTPGEWDLMDYGSYNNDSHTPPYLSAYERYDLGWLTPEELTVPSNVSLESIGNNKAYIIKTNKANEYFLLENRQQTGWDKYVPGHGMLIWHIDYNQSVWNNNEVNNTSSHQYVDIEEADGVKSDATRAGDPFPGTSGKTEFTDSTNPNMKTWASVSLNKPVTNIAETDGIVTFKFMGGESLIDTPVANDADQVTDNSFKANWEAVEGASEYILYVYTVEGQETKTVLSENFNGFTAGSTGSGASSSDVSSKLDQYTETVGWTGSRIYEAGGTIKLGASTSLGYIITPAIDLSGNSGAFNLSFDAMAWSTDTKELKIYLDNNLVYTITDLNNDATYTMKSYSVDLTGGLSGSKIKVEGNQSSKGRFFLDNLVVTQGGAVQTPVDGSPFTSTTNSYEVTGLENNTTYYYTVVAVSTEGEESSKSNEIEVVTSSTSGIEDNISGESQVYVSGDKLVIKSNSISASNLRIYDVSGRLLQSRIVDGELILSVNGFIPGIYIVKIGSDIYKVKL